MSADLIAGPNAAVTLDLLPEIADVLAHLALRDPDVLAAVEDVDRTLIREALHERPILRLVRSARLARHYARLARHERA